MTKITIDRAVAQQALEALSLALSDVDWRANSPTQPVIHKAHTALKAALAEPVQAPQCNPHPKAPHGFLRNASHNEDRYVCECEGWDPYEAGRQAGMEAALAQPQEPVPDKLEQLRAFCKWERVNSPHPEGLPHVAEWAVLEIDRLRAAKAQPVQDTDCHAQGICQRSGYGIGQRQP